MFVKVTKINTEQSIRCSKKKTVKIHCVCWAFYNKLLLISFKAQFHKCLIEVQLISHLFPSLALERDEE